MPGPVVAENLVMTIRGIEMLSDVSAWSTATANYISGHKEAGYSDVQVSIEVTKQVSSNEALNELLGRRLLSEWLPWLDNWQYPQQYPQPGRYYLRGGANNNSQQQRQRRLAKTKSVEVIYAQTTTWQTDNPDKYTDVVVATSPFTSRVGSQRYLKVLQSLSPAYLSITSIGSICVNPPPPGAPISDAILGIVRPPEKKSWSKKETSIVVVVCALIVLFGHCWH